MTTPELPRSNDRRFPLRPINIERTDMMNPDRKSGIMVPGALVEYKVDLLANELRRYLREFPEMPLLVGLAHGANVFTDALARSINKQEKSESPAQRLQVVFDSDRYITYDGVNKLPEPKRDESPKWKKKRPDYNGKKVILFDDILDTGHTISTAIRDITADGGEVTDVFFVVDKPEESEWRKDGILRTHPIPEGVRVHVLFRIPDLWAEGYGMDTDGKGRKRKDIIVRWDKEKLYYPDKYALYFPDAA